MNELVGDFVFVSGVMMVGAWLERLGGQDGFFDWLLTPAPLGISGLAIVFAERVFA